MNTEKRTIICGIDGCVVSTNGDVSAMHLESLKQLSDWIKEANQRIFPNIIFCTGRNGSYVQAIANYLGLPDCFAVIERGAFLFNPFTKEKIVNPTITPNTKSQFKKVLRRVVPRILEKHPVELCAENEICITFGVKYREPSERPFEKSRDEILREVYDAIRKEKKVRELIIGRILRITQSSWSVDLAPCTEISGLRFMAKTEGIDLAASLGIGSLKEDSFLKILRCIGCPSNASDVCKTLVRKRRGRVSHYTYAQGMIDIIEYFFSDIAQK